MASQTTIPLVSSEPLKPDILLYLCFGNNVIDLMSDLCGFQYTQHDPDIFPELPEPACVLPLNSWCFCHRNLPMVLTASRTKVHLLKEE
jgi:hypothetical protein